MKKYLAAGGVVLILVGGAYLFGRHSVPPKVEVRTETETKWKTKIQYVEKVVDRETTTTTTTKPDGTKIVVEVEKEHSETARESDTRSGSKKDTETTTKVGGSSWRVSAKAGVLFDGSLAVPSLAYGASIEKKILGPIWLGGFVLTNAGTSGVLPSKADTITAGGLQIGLEF